MTYFTRTILSVTLLGVTPVCSAYFAKVSNTGNALPTSTPLGTAPDDWACTYDSSNNLIWEIKTTDGGLRDIKWNYSWLNSDAKLNGGFAGFSNGGNCLDGSNCDTEKYVAQVNAQGLCGANDWRLPVERELYLLFLQTIQAPFFVNFQNSDTTKGFWSSTTNANAEKVNAEQANLRFYNNKVAGGLKSDQHGIMLVRNGQGFNHINFKETPEYKQLERWTFKTPKSIHLAPDETLLVADSFNHRIVNLSQDGKEIRSFGSFSDKEDSPTSIMVAPDGTLYANDKGNKRIQHFKMDGTLLSASEPEGYPSEEKSILAADGSSFVISDSGSFQRLQADGTLMWEFKYGQSVPDDSPYSSGIESIALALDGTLFVSGYYRYKGTLTTSRGYTYSQFKPNGTLISETRESCVADLIFCGDMFTSDNVTTKLGTRFQASIFLKSIQKLAPIPAEYVYTSSTGTAIFENITVGNTHYWVKLQDQGNAQFKVINAYPIKPALENNTSLYDPIKKLVTLPKVTANGLNYSIVLQLLDNGLFGVKSAIPLL